MPRAYEHRRRRTGDSDRARLAASGGVIRERCGRHHGAVTRPACSSDSTADGVFRRWSCRPHVHRRSGTRGVGRRGLADRSRTANWIVAAPHPRGRISGHIAGAVPSRRGAHHGLGRGRWANIIHRGRSHAVDLSVPRGRSGFVSARSGHRHRRCAAGSSEADAQFSFHTGAHRVDQWRVRESVSRD